MKAAAQFRHRLAWCITMLALVAMPCIAQNHRNEPAPRPSGQEPGRSRPSRPEFRQQQPRYSRPQSQPRYQSRPERGYQPPRYQSRPERGYQPQPRGYQSRGPQNYGGPQRNFPPPSQRNFQAQQQPRYNVPRPYQPPAQGHHSGQWLNRYRDQPLDQQRRALENDPTFRRLPPARQQQLEQRLQHFD